MSGRFGRKGNCAGYTESGGAKTGKGVQDLHGWGEKKFVPENRPARKGDLRGWHEMKFVPENRPAPNRPAPKREGFFSRLFNLDGAIGGRTDLDKGHLKD